MKIHGVKLENFMLFDKLDAEFSPNVNIICGENSTGKTALIKLLYACATSCPEMAARRNFEKQLEVTERAKGFISLTHSDFGLCYLHLFRKLRDLFSLNNEEGIKYLSNLRTTNPARISLNFDGEESLRFSLTGDKRKITDNAVNDEFQVPNILFTEFDFAKIVYVPPKEMISSTENFTSLYEEYHISFDETYYII